MASTPFCSPFTSTPTGKSPLALREYWERSRVVVWAQCPLRPPPHYCQKSLIQTTSRHPNLSWAGQCLLTTLTWPTSRCFRTSFLWHRRRRRRFPHLSRTTTTFLSSLRGQGIAAPASVEQMKRRLRRCRTSQIRFLGQGKLRHGGGFYWSIAFCFHLWWKENLSQCQY